MKKVLLLSHQGTGFVDKLVACFKQLDLKYIVLTSMPENAQDVRDAWQQKGFEFNLTQDHELTKADIDRACELEQFDCCISVWEGYRELMAYANKKLGALDIDPTVVSAVQDKLYTRQILHRSGLSSVKSYSIDDFKTQFTRGNLSKHFIKPRRGLGSLNSHSVSSIGDVDKSISNFTSAPKNIVFNDFYLENELYLEEYIDGVEVSFELLIHDNDVLFALEHEKYVMQERSETVLEKAVVSPSISLTREQIELGVRAATDIAKCLGLAFGCYHIEMKYTSADRWELIEVNPRVGGALIHDSTLLRTNYCLLQAWLRSLLGEAMAAPENEIDNLTYFEVEYAETGKEVLKICTNSHYPEPDMAVVLVKPGTKFDRSNLEIFIGLHLWVFESQATLKKLLSDVSQSDSGYLNVVYKP